VAAGSAKEVTDVKVALFNRVPYLGPARGDTWPVAVDTYTSDLAQQSMDASLEQFQLADELGFNWVTVAEHHYSPFSLTPNPMILAGALSQRVRSAKIALLGANIPIQNPVRVAEEFAMLDVLTGGRIVAGMLRGTPNEYVTYATNPAETRERFAEALALIVRAWTEPQPFGWQGRHFEYRDICIWPRPVQQPHPPIYMSGSSPESGEWAARHRISIGLAVTTLPLAAKAAAHYRACAEATGWQPEPENVLYRVVAHVAESDDEALADLQRPGPAPAVRLSGANPAVEAAVAGAGYHGRDREAQQNRTRMGALQERLKLGQLLAGSPERVVAQIRTLHREIGMGVLDVSFQPVGREKSLRAIELFGTEVLPRLREL
jgi:alkanesulfonate monooxygenase SsuD/methylene tetrahydromethanopterin reductase-like flavin-dependent oxidoreductase (luciferase family)